jgi:hypothetical protein
MQDKCNFREKKDILPMDNHHKDEAKRKKIRRTRKKIKTKRDMTISMRIKGLILWRKTKDS